MKNAIVTVIVIVIDCNAILTTAKSEKQPLQLQLCNGGTYFVG